MPATSNFKARYKFDTNISRKSENNKRSRKIWAKEMERNRLITLHLVIFDYQCLLSLFHFLEVDIGYVFFVLVGGLLGCSGGGTGTCGALLGGVDILGGSLKGSLYCFD